MNRLPDVPEFTWESGTLATLTPLPVTYLVGYPVDVAAHHISV